jgi:hypothetical protein
MEKKQLIPASAVTEETIQDWKQQYGTIARLKVKENGQQKFAYVRKPTNKEIDFASANLTRGALTQYGITLFNTCQIGGDSITTEEGLRSVGQSMNELIETVEVELEKL